MEKPSAFCCVLAAEKRCSITPAIQVLIPQIHRRPQGDGAEYSVNIFIGEGIIALINEFTIFLLIVAEDLMFDSTAEIFQPDIFLYFAKNPALIAQILDTPDVRSNSAAVVPPYPICRTEKQSV